MRSALLWLTLAACSSEGAVEIRVLPPEGGRVTEVELYVGIYDPTTDAIAPAQGGTSATVWWKRDPDRDLDVQPMTADGALFAFEGGSTSTLAAVVAVGFADDGQGNAIPVASAVQLVSTDIPDDEIHRYELSLGAFQALPRTPGEPPQAPGLQVWGPADDPRQCVMVDNVPELAAYSGVTSAMIVSGHDPDCDGVPDDDATECRPREFMSADPIQRATLGCVIDATYEGTASCVVGGPSCVDTVGTTDCAPSNYCTSTALCAAGCDNGACNDPAALLQTAHLECPLPYVGDSEVQFCASFPALIALTDNGAPLGPVVCDDALPALIRNFQQPFSGQVSYAQDQISVHISTKSASLCKYLLTVEGAGLPLLTESKYAGAVAIPLLSPADRGVVLPVVFTPTLIGTDCNTSDYTSVCQLIFPSAGSDPGLNACLAAPVEPSQIATD